MQPTLSYIFALEKIHDVSLQIQVHRNEDHMIDGVLRWYQELCCRGYSTHCNRGALYFDDLILHWHYHTALLLPWAWWSCWNVDVSIVLGERSITTWIFIWHGLPTYVSIAHILRFLNNCTNGFTWCINYVNCCVNCPSNLHKRFVRCYPWESGNCWRGT